MPMYIPSPMPVSWQNTLRDLSVPLPGGSRLPVGTGQIPGILATMGAIPGETAGTAAGGMLAGPAGATAGRYLGGTLTGALGSALGQGMQTLAPNMYGQAPATTGLGDFFKRNLREGAMGELAAALSGTLTKMATPEGKDSWLEILGQKLGSKAEKVGVKSGIKAGIEEIPRNQQDSLIDRVLRSVYGEDYLNNSVKEASKIHGLKLK